MGQAEQQEQAENKEGQQSKESKEIDMLIIPNAPLFSKQRTDTCPF